MTNLTVTVGDYPTFEGMKNGETPLAGFEVSFTPIDGGMPQYFRRMVRGLEFDVCELAISTYLTARAAGVPITAIPVFPVREFPHRALVERGATHDSNFQRLEGQSIGVRAYTVTTGMWARAVLADQLDVDISTITWVINDEEHVKEFKQPANVLYQPGADLAGMLRDGELAAGIGIARPGDGIVNLLDDKAKYEESWRERGIIPINHTVAILNSVLEQDEMAAQKIFNWMNTSALAGVHAEHEGSFSGLEESLPTLEFWMQRAVDQHLIDKEVAVESLFASVS